MSRSAIHISRQRAVLDSTGARHCAWCGDYIDPADWCLSCKTLGVPCATEGGPHRRLRKRADAAFCNSECKAQHRLTFIRDCVPLR